jgi:DNA-binding SARP family transcriptional activator
VSGSAAAAWEPLAVRLTARIVDLLGEPGEIVAGQVEEIVLTADVHGWPWLSRIARGLQAAILLAAAPAPWRVSAAAELLEDLERHGDRWTVCLTSLAIGAVHAHLDQPELAQRTLRRAEDVAAELGAPVLRVWASVLRTAVGVQVGEPEAEQQATAALRAAAGLGVTHASTVAEQITQIASPEPGRTQPPAVDRPAVHRPALSGRSDSSSVTLRCLGGFSLAAEGVELPWRELRPRVRALLMLLAMNHGRHLHRELLVDALWPDATLVSGVRSLQVAVSSIRQCLGAVGITEDALRRRDDAYALQFPAVADQLADFERLAYPAGPESPADGLRRRLAALAAYTGDLLPEVGPAEWAVDERARLRLLAASVGAEAARDALAAGQLRVALDAARRSVALDPYHDSSWQLVVAINERLGDQSAATVARRQHAQVWADLGLVTPGASDRRPTARRF